MCTQYDTPGTLLPIFFKWVEVIPIRYSIIAEQPIGVIVGEGTTPEGHYKTTSDLKGGSAMG
jgi:hypothetical protein